MSARKLLKAVRLTNTMLFVASLGYAMLWALHQVSKSWWYILSLSGYPVIILFVLMGLYFFAVFRGVARSQKIAVEHPLTCSFYYSVFYEICPLLGALSGSLGAIGVSNITHYLLLTAAGCLWVTFFIWIVVDPMIGLAEMTLSASRRNRQQRLAEAKAIREKERLTKEKLLAEVEAKDRLERQRWKKLLMPNAERLAYLLGAGELSEKNKEAEAVDIGVNAWQMGGLNCMEQLHSMAINICRSKYRDRKIVDYISIWWDGIGSWRCRWFEGESESTEERRILNGIENLP